MLSILTASDICYSEMGLENLFFSCHLASFYLHFSLNSSGVSNLFSRESMWLEKPTDKRLEVNYLSILPSSQSLKSFRPFISLLISSSTFLLSCMNIYEPSSYSNGLVFMPEKFRVAKFIFDFQMCCFSRRSRFYMRSSKFPDKKNTSIKLFNFYGYSLKTSILASLCTDISFRMAWMRVENVRQSSISLSSCSNASLMESISSDQSSG